MKKKKSVWSTVMAVIVIIILVVVIGFGTALSVLCYKEAHVPEATDDYSAMVVLGSQVLPDGTPNLQLEWRLQLALEMYQQKNVPVIVCGAQGNNESEPEAVSMRKWLCARGVPQEMIYEEADSFNTLENLKNAKGILDENGMDDKVLVITSNYHLPRALAIAEDAGLSAQGAGSRILTSYWIKNHFREVLAWGKYLLQKVGLPL